MSQQGVKVAGSRNPSLPTFLSITAAEPTMKSPAFPALLLTIAVLGTLATPVAVPAAAKAPPEPVCGVCTNALESAANERGVDLERGQSSMVVELAESGRASLTANVEIQSGAAALRNDTLRTAIVRDVSYVVVKERLDLRTAMNGDVLVVRYAAADLAHQTLGVLQFDAFQTRGAPLFAIGGEGSPYPGADELTLRGPPGYLVQGSHGSWSNATAIRWQGDSHERFAGHIEEDVTISFVDRNVALPGLRVAVANAVDGVDTLLG